MLSLKSRKEGWGSYVTFVPLHRIATFTSHFLLTHCFHEGRWMGAATITLDHRYACRERATLYVRWTGLNGVSCSPCVHNLQHTQICTSFLILRAIANHRTPLNQIIHIHDSLINSSLHCCIAVHPGSPSSRIRITAGGRGIPGHDEWDGSHHVSCRCRPNATFIAKHQEHVPAQYMHAHELTVLC
jgi:hypothetical protein